MAVKRISGMIVNYSCIVVKFHRQYLIFFSAFVQINSSSNADCIRQTSKAGNLFYKRKSRLQKPAFSE
ncbi:MAG: hypothetical protein ABRQ29_06845, partial [Smithellaceae bacterium]